MFKDLQNPMSYVKTMTDMYAAVPKTPAEGKALFEKFQGIIKDEYDNSVEMWKTYKKASTGDATMNELTVANKKATELLKSTTFASVLALPGAMFILPSIVEKAKEYDIDMVPESVAKRFSI